MTINHKLSQAVHNCSSYPAPSQRM